MGDTTQSGRLDELLVKGSYRVADFSGFRVYPSIGFALTGDLGGESIQNNVHESVDEPLLDLPYDYSSQFGVLLGARFAYRKEWNSDGNLPYYWESDLDYYLVSDYASHLLVETGFYLGRPWNDRIGIRLAYQNQDMMGSPTASAVGDQETGIRLGFSQDISFFMYSWDVYFPSTFSTGRIGINLLKLNAPGDFKSEDLSVEFNMLFDRGGYLNKYKRQVAHLWSLPLHVSINHAFGAYSQAQIPVYPNVRGQYIQLGVGGELSWQEVRPEFQINPYLGLGAGVRDEMTYSGDDATVQNTHSIAPVVYGEFGLRIGGPLPFLPKNTIVAFQLGNKLSVPLYSDVQSLQGQKVEFLTPVNNPYIGFNFSVDI
ncbi:hypothetical protein KFE98_19315 [bacterium SCSIO 12741]|nr:hypothetical protein KFE98_19315 [bacterium SCSIO 12741]